MNLPNYNLLALTHSFVIAFIAKHCESLDDEYRVSIVTGVILITHSQRKFAFLHKPVWDNFNKRPGGNKKSRDTVSLSLLIYVLDMGEEKGAC